MIIGNEIKSKRLEKGWSIYRLSKESGVQRTHIKQIEEGNLDPRWSTINALLTALEKE